LSKWWDKEALERRKVHQSVSTVFLAVRGGLMASLYGL